MRIFTPNKVGYEGWDDLSGSFLEDGLDYFDQGVDLIWLWHIDSIRYYNNRPYIQ